MKMKMQMKMLVVVAMACVAGVAVQAVRMNDAEWDMPVPERVPLVDFTEHITMRGMQLDEQYKDFGNHVKELFDQWAKYHAKEYANDSERNQRLDTFLDNLMYIREHRNTNKHLSYTVGLNSMADITLGEFSNMYLGTKPTAASRNRLPDRALVADDELTFVPAELNGETLNWVEKGAVTEVKNQKACGSCWSFSTTGSIEGINAIVSGKLVSLSEQELVDCDTILDHGCQGGLMDYAYAFVEGNGGLDTEDDYPYTAFQGTCDSNKKNRNVISIDGHRDITAGDEKALLEAAKKQPVSVAIQANQRFFQLYTGGVFDNESCGSQLDHAVLVAGYGTSDGKDYWLMKNSWGAQWGEDGYMKMAMGVAPSGICGISKMASYPVKTHVDPPAPPPAPPSPPPPVVQCNQVQACPKGNTCCCMIEVFGQCAVYSCCPYEEAACCDDKKSCCPGGTECNLDAGTCDKTDGAPSNETLSMMSKSFAQFHILGAGSDHN